MANLSHVHGTTAEAQDCPECGPHKYEIRVRPSAEYVAVSHWIFRSWTGPRKLDGIEYVGPTFNLGGTEEVAR
jgi:hypothetical protein